MPDDTIYIPFNKELYDDLVRFSDGTIDVSNFAETQIMDYMERNVGGLTSKVFGPRALDFYRKYFPDYAKEAEERIKRIEDLSLVELFDSPLVWKDITVEPGSKVRMQYGGTHHFAIVRDGKIEDEAGRFSPSQWARHIASGTSRNAWRDIEFMLQGSTIWVLADDLRKKARQLKGRE